ncbi:dipeptidase [soil metagenome]
MKKIIVSLIFLNAVNAAFAQNMKDDELLIEAKRIHDKVITIDTHADINVRNFTVEQNYTMDLDSQVTLPKMKAGGLDVAWFIVYTGQAELNAVGYKKAHENAMEKFDAIHRLVKEIAPNQIGLATTSAEVRNLINEGKLVGMIGVENGYSIGEDLANIEKFYNLGARYLSLAHNGHSQLSDSNTGEGDNVWLHNGLSELGKEAVKEMNRLGMMIDVSHPSKEAIKQMFAISKAPLIASHSSARALCDHSRNLDDELLLLFKENGGVVQTVAFSSYVSTEKHNAFATARTELLRSEGENLGVKVLDREEVRALSVENREMYNTNIRKVETAAAAKLNDLKKEVSPVNVSDFVDHIDYMVKLIGIKHVGISSDFDGGGGIEGWDDASETLNVTIELVKRGYSEQDIEKLWGGNLLRVMDEVEAVAAEIQKS